MTNQASLCPDTEALKIPNSFLRNLHEHGDQTFPVKEVRIHECAC